MQDAVRHRPQPDAAQEGGVPSALLLPVPGQSGREAGSVLSCHAVYHAAGDSSVRQRGAEPSPAPPFARVLTCVMVSPTV